VRILVLGAAGMLGRKMMEVLADGHSVLGAARQAKDQLVGCDVTRLDDVRSAVRRIMPQAIVNCAAYTAVDLCETQTDLAFLVNAIGARNVAIAASEVSADLFHVSTDYVFDGTKDGDYTEYDAPNPISAYGRSKLAGEAYVRQLCAKSYVGRTQWLYGEGGKNFADTMLRLASERPELRVVDDQWGKPCYTGDVARQTKLLLESRQYGLYHLASGGRTTWYRFAKAILERAGQGAHPITPITTADYPTPARRPASSALRNMNLDLTIGDSMPAWESGLDEFMARRARASERGQR
jgi:dTDP-4-dehydrorhamnose reductase